MQREFPPGRKRCPYCWQYLIADCKKRVCPGRGHWPPLAGGDPWAEALQERLPINPKYRPDRGEAA